uniref:Ribonuclease 3 n=1 Tax=Psoroptes ovis TaxID=83912 RepID=A0A3B0R2M1_PSOOV|nr:Ribonuclease 3 [Psoroptes ovis]
MELREKFRNEIIKRSEIFRSQKPAFTFPKRKLKLRAHVHHHDKCGYSCDDNNNSPNDSCCDSEDDSFGSDDDDDNENSSMKELERKRSHPYRLHDELWYNEPGEMNDGLLCRCSLKAQRCGIRHGIYLGEEHLPKCDPHTNNRNRLYHYVITITPKTNFLVDQPTRIKYDDHYYYFEGYSLFSHQPIPDTFPSCKIIRYNIGYEIKFIEDDFPQNFCVDDLDLIFDYIFYELLELVDFNMKAKNDNDGCNRFHLMPRFVRLLENKDNDSDNNGKELLSMSLVMDYLLKQSRQLIDETNLDKYNEWSTEEWNKFATKHKGFIVTCPSMKPCSIRVDQIDREKEDTSGNGHEVKNENEDKYPVIVHFGIRPPQLSYAGNPKYQKAWRDYVKYRHLLANKEKVTYEDKEILAQKEEKLQEMRMKTDLKRDVTIVVSSKNFYCTGIQCDIVQYSLIIPVLISHLRFHYSLQHLEKNIDYIFNDRSLLQLSLTHPSYRENFGTNPDHARNTLTNCGLRYLEYGDRKVHFMNTRKRGINMLINIMSRFGCNEETVSNINHNERLEFLGDAVVEFLASIHLYFLFPDLEEGGLATYRAALVQNQHLAVLAKKLQLEKFMLYAHGSDLCHDLELRHAMANCFEAFMGALFLDGGIEIADRIFSSTLFDGDDEQSKLLHKIWIEYPPHPIQSQYPDGDRHLIEKVNRLKELSIFEQMTGIQFRHIRLLARAFTHRSVGFNNLTLGSNQRMEFLGDTVLQLIASEYLYKYFPDHHEGHLSLLRSSLVNNKTQSVVCDDLGIIDMTQYNSIKSELKTKDRADLLEAFIGALYVDKGIDYCRRFCEVCFFPRLQQFIMNQDWNDPKSKLQQCCLTLRSADCGEPDIPTYKYAFIIFRVYFGHFSRSIYCRVIDSKGPTNTRIYEVAVYFRDSRLATGKGHSIQEAEMNAATNALRLSKETCDTTEHKQNSGGKFLRNSNSSK